VFDPALHDLEEGLPASLSVFITYSLEVGIRENPSIYPRENPYGYLECVG
jgi:hypothetical protein